MAFEHKEKATDEANMGYVRCESRFLPLPLETVPVPLNDFQLRRCVAFSYNDASGCWN